MKVSELWLREWVNPSLDIQQLAARLTMAGLEVDAINDVAGVFDRVIVAQVTNTSPHPQADKLTLCEINTGETSLKVVCGAANVRAGLKVALAQIGANLPGGLLIKESTLRGELSQGMLCSTAELGLADHSDGILELEENAPIGVNLRDYLLLNDRVLDIDLTPNRADCFSMLGIAREVATLTNSSLIPVKKQDNQPTIDEALTIQLKAPTACPHYCGRIIRNINSAALTPLWMIERLRRAGLRAIHPVVDVTNYVMLELGQPMHAFDLHAIEGDIIVRFANPDESLELLDGQEVMLDDNVLVIADNKKTLALAGIMGGNLSAVNEQSVDIFLESAYFNPLSIAGVARGFGLFTDSSQRFERGVDFNLQLTALERATTLLLEIVGGEIGPISLVSESASIPKAKTVLFNPTKVKQLTGVIVAEVDMLKMLQDLGMIVDQSANIWSISVPSHRFDIHFEVDVVEEIIRLHGYENMQGTKMIANVQVGTINPYEALATQLGQFFIARGYHETISYSFVDPELQQALYPNNQVIELINPISTELSQMRAGMWSGLLASMIYNVHRQQTAIKFFENGVIFDKQNGIVQEHPSIAGLLTGEQGALNWSELTSKFDFFDLKGDLQALFASMHYEEVKFVPALHPALHPGKSAAIMIDNEQAGWCGVLHPRITDALDISDEVMLFELRLNALTKQKKLAYQQISKFPQIRRDLSLLVPQTINVEQIEFAVRNTVNSNKLKAFNVFDLYTGESIPQGKKSVAIALTLQDAERTMVDSEINVIIDAIIKKLEEEFAIILRD